MTTAEERISFIEGRLDSLATKEDVAGLRAEIKEDMANLRADLRTEIKSEANKLIVWLAGLQLVGLGVIAALLRLFVA